MQASVSDNISPIEDAVAKVSTTSGPYIAIHDGKDSLVVSRMSCRSAKMDNNFVPVGTEHLPLFPAAQ